MVVPVQGKWKTILIQKYGPSGLDIPRLSYFWKGVLNFRDIYELGINRIVNNGQEIPFWLDRWIGECSLYCLYPNLFQIASNQAITVAEAFPASSSLTLSFNKQLTGVLLLEWHQLRQSISFTYKVEYDLITWRWTANGLFTVHSLYKWLEFGGIKNSYFNTIWKAKIPLKIKVFLWLLKQDRVLTKSNLIHRGWQGDPACLFCGAVEISNHLFITCPYTKSIWSWIANHNGFTFNYESVEDLWLIDCCISLKDKLFVKLVRASTLWSIWLARNKVCFENATIPPLTSIGSNIISLASYWCKTRNDDTYFKLTLILPMDVYNLNQGGSLTILPVSDTQEEYHSGDIGDVELGYGAMDLSEYLVARLDPELSNSGSASTPSNGSYMECNSTSPDSIHS